MYICGIRNKTVIGYKYFDFNGATKMSIKYRGSVKGKLCVAFSENGENIAKLKITPSENWTILTQAVKFPNGTKPLFLWFNGKGKLDLLEITFE